MVAFSNIGFTLLRRLRSSKSPVSTQYLAEMSYITTASALGVLSRMLKHGYVRRVEDTSAIVQGRNAVWEITPEGLHFLTSSSSRT